MKKCPVHIEFFDDSCEACRQEYVEMKGADRQDEMVVADSNKKHYKELTEDRAKKLYEELMLQYLKGDLEETMQHPRNALLAVAAIIMDKK